MGMSGSEWLGLALGGPLGLGVASGLRGQKEQKRAQREQERAQQQAETLAQRQMRENSEALAKARRRQPDFGSLLTSEQQRANRGLGSTMLTGPMGVTEKSRLGRTSLLGT